MSPGNGWQVLAWEIDCVDELEEELEDEKAHGFTGCFSVVGASSDWIEVICLRHSCLKGVSELRSKSDHVMEQALIAGMKPANMSISRRLSSFWPLLRLVADWLCWFMLAQLFVLELMMELQKRRSRSSVW